MTDKDKLEKLKKLADAMYYAAQQLTADASRLHKAIDEYHKFIINEYHKEEPVSEEWIEELRTKLDSLSKEDFEKVWKKYGAEEKEEPTSEDLEKAAEEWDESLYRSDAFKAGANWQKEQMMANAVDAVVKIDAGGYPYVDRTIELYDYDKDIPLAKRGDKVKILVIKES